MLVTNKDKMEDPNGHYPIGLCNVIYKVITKIIANQLKPFLLRLISLEKKSYDECFQILNGIMVAHETIHYLKLSKKCGMLFKLNLSKSFDKLNW